MDGGLSYDYKRVKYLFNKYIDFVIDHEGTDFLDFNPGYEVKFTQEEIDDIALYLGRDTEDNNQIDELKK
jgi:hypothetical protein